MAVWQRGGCEVIVSVIVKRARPRIVTSERGGRGEWDRGAERGGGASVNYDTVVIPLFPHFRMQRRFIICRVK